MGQSECFSLRGVTVSASKRVHARGRVNMRGRTECFSVSVNIII